MELTTEEIRVAGSLLEKQLTTPQQYPLTLNALTLACNQASNRFPVVAYEEPEVEEAVRRLKIAGLARFVHPSHGRSVLRYQHTLDEALGLDARGLAVLAVLMLRGPQTVGELRIRTERMVDFGDLEEVGHELQRLADHPERLVTMLPRRPGQKEERYAQLLAGPIDVTAIHSEAAGEFATRPSRSLRDPVPEVAEQLDDLRAQMAALRHDLDEVRTELGLDTPDGTSRAAEGESEAPIEP